MIESYSFGEIKIDDKKYTNDVILFPNRISDNWWREEGHSLSKKDIGSIIEKNPDTLVIGTGAYGRLEVPSETKEYIESKDIELIEEKTKKACETYNKLEEKNKKVIGAFHLTC